MSKTRVDLLEFVHVDHQKTQWTLPPLGMAYEPSGDTIQRTAVVYLGKRFDERLLLGHPVLQSTGDYLLTQTANFKTLRHQIGIQQCKQNEQSNYKRTGNGEFEVNGVIFEGSAEKQGKQPRAHQHA